MPLKTRTPSQVTRSRTPKIVVLCGSSRYVELMAICAWFIERDEEAIALTLHLLPWWYGAKPDHLAEEEGVAAQMDKLHLRKIDLADQVFIVNYADYIGQSTLKEITYAQHCHKPLRWYSHDPVGEKVQRLLMAATQQTGLKHAPPF